MLKHTLRRKCNQRLLHWRQGLQAQAVEHLARGSQVNDVNVAARTKLKKALRACAGVLRSLSLQSMGEKKHESAWLPPFGFRAHHELIDHDLSYIGKIAELGLPDYQTLRSIDAVAKLEADRRALGEGTVTDRKTSLIRS